MTCQVFTARLPVCRSRFSDEFQATLTSVWLSILQFHFSIRTRRFGPEVLHFSLLPAAIPAVRDAFRRHIVASTEPSLKLYCV